MPPETLEGYFYEALVGYFLIERSFIFIIVKILPLQKVVPAKDHQLNNFQKFVFVKNIT